MGVQRQAVAKLLASAKLREKKDTKRSHGRVSSNVSNRSGKQQQCVGYVGQVVAIFGRSEALLAQDELCGLIQALIERQVPVNLQVQPATVFY